MVETAMLLAVFCGLDAAIVLLACSIFVLGALLAGIPSLVVFFLAPVVVWAAWRFAWKLSEPLWTRLVECEIEGGDVTLGERTAKSAPSLNGVAIEQTLKLDYQAG